MTAARLAPPYRGRTAATGFVLDVALIGTTEARRRVLAHWAPGVTLYELPGARWLLVLPLPVEVSCERSPGLPLRRSAGGGLSAATPGDGGPPAGTVRLLAGGAPADLVVAGLPALDPASWLDLGELSFHRLAPVQLPRPQPVPAEPALESSTVDIRAAAGVGQRTARAAEAARELAGGTGWPAGRGAPAAPPAQPRHSRALAAVARLALRSPAAGQIGRRHAKYLRSLTSQFERREYDEALRNAIGLGGVGGLLWLGLPKRRGRVTGPTLGESRPGGSIPYDDTVQEHLRALYHRGAADLERTGELEAAAFVLADLLNQPGEAVALLERHGRLELAARLAESRRLDAALVVRLWWRAGDRSRAVAVARTRGAFAAAVQRLEKVDEAGAGELRLAWAASNRAAGDHLGAVEAVWQVPGLRGTAVPDIQAGMALGGPIAAHLFAYLIAYRVTGSALAGAIALLAGEDELRPARDRFLAALAQLPAADPAADRELVSAAVRLMISAEPTPAADEPTARRLWNQLRDRADPVLWADLPPLSWQGRPAAGGRVWVDALDGPGQLPVYDAAVLAGGAVLVAHGNLGARLLTLDGRVRAGWDAPTHRLVLADHGGSALLAAAIGADTWELRRLDLAARRLRPWTVLRARHLEPVSTAAGWSSSTPTTTCC